MPLFFSMQPLVWVSVSDYLSAKICAENGVDALLVGDSLGMTVYGFSSTRMVTCDMMIRHTEAVMRAVPNDFPVVADIPLVALGSERALLAFAQDMKRIGCRRLKIEGGCEVFSFVELLVDHGIEVAGHLGLLPQTAEGFLVVGKITEDARKMTEDALGLQKRGVANIVLECVPAKLAKEISGVLDIPTIGIGAGDGVSSQILVYADIIGRTERGFSPRFLRRFGDAANYESFAIRKFAASVRRGEFPTLDESY
jgi:3-methyl-2-oxobutanoate hydroxymethyltransferase